MADDESISVYIVFRKSEVPIPPLKNPGTIRCQNCNQECWVNGDRDPAVYAHMFVWCGQCAVEIYEQRIAAGHSDEVVLFPGEVLDNQQTH